MKFDPCGWKVSSYTAEGNTCIEVNLASTQVGVRDTKNRDAGHIAVSARSWAAFVNNVVANDGFRET